MRPFSVLGLGFRGLGDHYRFKILRLTAAESLDPREDSKKSRLKYLRVGNH